VVSKILILFLDLDALDFEELRGADLDFVVFFAGMTITPQELNFLMSPARP
jgi:hypothetical protein